MFGGIASFERKGRKLKLRHREVTGAGEGRSSFGAGVISVDDRGRRSCCCCCKGEDGNGMAGER